MWYHVKLFNLLGLFNRYAPRYTTGVLGVGGVGVIFVPSVQDAVQSRMDAENPDIHLLNMQCTGGDASHPHLPTPSSVSLLFSCISWRNE